MTFLLDSNTCIRYLNGTSESVRQHMERASPNDLVLCSIVNAELLFGAFKSERLKQNLTKVSRFMERFASLPFDDAAARHYGKIRTRLGRQGLPIGPNDLLIAAIALANDATLVTHNIGEFSRVKRLKFVDWEEP